ncbi:MAG: HisA/HisF-related TIM barrel protein [Gemmatimonadales bacterium]
MRIIPVLDLAAGAAVHAAGGARVKYRPVESVLVPGGPVDPRALARGYREQLGAHECYAADLDAIEGRVVQRKLLRDLADRRLGFGDGLLVDAGAADVAGARHILDLGASGVVIGLETLGGMDELARIVTALGAERISLSLDLRQGRPLAHPGNRDRLGPGSSPVQVAELAYSAGVRSILVLDLARVGAGSGADHELLANLQRALPEVSFLVGGGIAGREELGRLRASGCAGALVASAIHDGRITAADLAEYS